MCRLPVRSWPRRLIVMSAMIIAAAGCAAPNSVPSSSVPLTVEAAATHTPTLSPTATATPDVPSATATPTPQPTATFTPTPQPTASPTPTPSPTVAATATPVSMPTVETAASVTADTEMTPSAEADLLPLDGERASAFQRILDDALDDGNTQGAVLSVHVAGYEPWFGAGGHADVEQMRPMEPLTPYHIGSITKLFTAVVVMQLVQEGQIQLDTPLDRWLPQIVPDADSITVRQLLNHTSGMPDYLQDHRFIDRAYEDPDRIWMPHEIITHVVSTMPSPSPEKQWAYSNTNYVLLGVLVEQVTGNTLAHEIRQRILDPLSMTETVFPPDEAVPPHTARGYVGSYALAQGVDSFVWATGNIVSTTGDMQRFAEALFTGDLLDPSTRATMLDVVPALPRHGLNMLEYGLGIMRTEVLVDTDAVTRSVLPDPFATQMPLPEPIAMLGHNGGWAGFRAALWYVPEIEATIVVGLNQAQTSPMPIVVRIVEQLMAQQ